MSDWADVRDAAHRTGDGWGWWLLDKNMEPLADLHGCVSIEIPESVNETSALKLELRDDHPAFDFLLPFDMLDPGAPELTWRALVHESQWIMVEGPRGAVDRLVYRVARITDSVGNGEAHGTVTVEAKSLFRYIEKIALRASPNDPLIAQLKYRDFRAGDSLRVLKEYLLVNLMRDFQPRAIKGWNLWSSNAWASVRPDAWPAIVSPVHESTSTQVTVLDARFDMAGDFFKDTLDAAGLMLSINLWLPGDEQPAPSHVQLRLPTLWIDIVPRQYDTSTTGHALDLFRGLIRQFDREANAPRIGMGTTPATLDHLLPWVVWRPEDMAGITSDFTVVKSEDWHVTVGGRSPEIVNKLIGAGSKALFSGLAAGLAQLVPVFGPLIAAAGAFLGEISAAALKDKLFAWNEFSDTVRRAAHGRFAYRDQVGAGDGWSLSAFQQGFEMLQQGAGMVSIGFQVSEQTVYRWGEHYRAGDQQGVVHRSVVFATYVSNATLHWSVADGWKEELTLGDPRARESYERGYTRSLKSISNAIDRVKTFVH